MVQEKICLNCGAKKHITKHHLTNLRPLRRHKHPPEWIPLCRKCHDAIESAKISLMQKRRFTFEQIRGNIKDLGTLELYFLYNEILNEVNERMQILE